MGRPASRREELTIHRAAWRGYDGGVPPTSVLPVLEAVYDLDSDDATWLASLAEAAQRVFPHADGGAAYMYELSATPRLTAAAGHDEIVCMPALVHTAFSLDVVRRAYGGSPRAMPVSWSWADARGPVVPHPLAVAFRPLGLSDGYAVLVPDGRSGLAIAIGMPTGRYRNAHRTKIASLNDRWTAVAQHCRAALRVRAAVATGSCVGELDAIGRGELGPTAAADRSALMEHIGRWERAHGDPRTPTSLWGELLDGRWSIIQHRRHAGRVRYLVVENPCGDVLRRLSALERRVVLRTAAGDAHKAIAIDFGLQESSIAGALQRALRKLGVSNRAQLVRLAAALSRPLLSSAGGAQGTGEDRDVTAPLDPQLA